MNTSRQSPDSGSGRGLLYSVWLFLVATGVALLVVGWAVVDARDDATVRGGLDYGVFLSSLDELMEEAKADTLVRFERLEGRLGDGRGVPWDTLVVTADPARYPSLRPGGFLRDQVDRYNRFQRERLALGAENPVWFERLAPYNPSVFRVGRDGEGVPSLGRTGEAWSLRVLSPFEGRWGGEIRARDARRGAGLLGPGVSVSLRQPTRLFRTVDGRRQRCEFEPGALQVQAFCLSEQRVPQATFRLVEDDPTPRTAVAGWTDLWVDGGRVAAGDSVEVGEGSILQLDPLEPMLLGEYWEGILSREQWVNGRERRVADLDPPLDLFRPLESAGARPASSPDAAVEVSIHAEASLDLTSRLRSFIDRRVALPVEGAMVVLARIPDGEIVAVAEVGRRSTPGRSALLEPVAPGSAVKPLVVAAALSQRPELGTLRIPARSGDLRSVLGLAAVPERRALASSLNCARTPDGWLGLREAVRCSNNEFAASLTVASLLPDGVWRKTPGDERVGGSFRTAAGHWSGLRAEIGWPGGTRRGEIDRATLLTSDLAIGLAEVFDRSPDPVVADRIRRTDSVWRGLRLTDGTPLAAPSSARPSVSRPLLLATPGDSSTDLGLLYRWGVGAWENRWTLIDLAEGFGRVVTDRRMGLRFTRSAATEAVPEPIGLGEGAWYRELMAGLRDVASDGTASGLAQEWTDRGLPPDIVAKTGTLAEAGGAGRADDLYLKSLLFAVGSAGVRPGAPLECGVVGAIYIRFAEGPERGSLPPEQTRFAEEELGDFLRDRWEAFGVCPGGS